MCKIVTGLLFLSCFSFCIEKAHSSLPEFEPTRFWQGSDYAQTLVEYVRRTHPDLKLIVDISDLRFFEKPEDRTLDISKSREAIKKEINSSRASMDSFATKIVESGRNILPESITFLSRSLEYGDAFYLNEPIALTQKKEDILKEWILSQDDHTIEPHVLMTKAIEICNGRIISAWAICWNVLRSNWEAAAVRNYGIITQKMVSVTGERKLWQSSAHLQVIPEKNRTTSDVKIINNGIETALKDQTRALKMTITKRGDDFSYLYHRIGVELLAMVTAKYSGYNFVGASLAKIGGIAEWAKFTDTAGIKRERSKRLRNDITAGTSGAKILSLIESSKPTKFSNTERYPEVDAHLYLTPHKFYYGGSYLLDNGRPSIYEGSKVNPKYWDSEITIEELKFRFQYGTRFDSDALDMVLLLANGDYELLHKGLVDYMNSNIYDAELNNYLADHLSGVKAFPANKDIKTDLALNEDINLDFMKQVWANIDLNEARKKWEHLIQHVLLAKKTKTSQCLQFY